MIGLSFGVALCWLGLASGSNTLCGIGAFVLWAAVIMIAAGLDEARASGHFWGHLAGWTAIPFVLGGIIKLAAQAFAQLNRKGGEK